MTKEELAARLNGSEYPMRIDTNFGAAIRDAHLGVVCGRSDDNVQFFGAIEDEVDAYQGVTVLFDQSGLIFNEPPNADLSKENGRKAMRYWLDRMERGCEIKALWCDDASDYAWSFETDIPHAAFDVMDEGDRFCRAIVFSLLDLTPETTP